MLAVVHCGCRRCAGRKVVVGPRRAGLAGDEDFAEGAVGEHAEGVLRVLERHRRFDVDAELAGGDEVEQVGELVGGGVGHDRRQREVVPAEHLRGGTDSGGDGAAGPHQGSDGCGVAGEVQCLVDTVASDVADGGGEVTGPVDGMRGAQAADVLLLLAGPRGADSR